MSGRVYHADEDAEYYFHEGCHILELLNSDSSAQLSIARARVAPGRVTLWHRLRGVYERYVITSGHAEVEVGDKLVDNVGPGDVVDIPPGTRQRIRNTGADDLVFLAICTPRFQPHCYQAVD